MLNICLYCSSFLGFAENSGMLAVLATVGEVYRSLLIIEQDSLEEYKALPSSLSISSTYSGK